MASPCSSCNSDGDPSREADYLEMLLEQRVRGVLVSPFAELTPAVPNGFVGEGSPSSSSARRWAPDWCSAAVDDVVGGELAVNHLLEQGHRRIAFVGGVLHARCVADRLVGARQALASAGRDPDSLTVIETAGSAHRRGPAGR